MDSHETLAEICLKAADLIATRGLAKNMLIDEKGAICNNGAVLIAMNLPELDLLEAATTKDVRISENLAAIRSVESLILGEMRVSETMPWSYNDLDSTTAEDVILLLKRTAERIRESQITVSLTSFVA